MLQALIALLVAALVGHPLLIWPTRAVAIVAGVAALACAAGATLRVAPVFTLGVALALAGHAFALVLSDSPPRLIGAVAAGIVAALALEVADFERRFRDVTIGPGVLRGQLWYWAKFAALGGLAGVALLGGAGVVNATVRMPWSPVAVAAGVVAALGAVALALRRS